MNAFTVVLAMGGSTNVALHGVEIARAAGHEFWNDVISQSDFNALSRSLPVLVDMRPFGRYSMIDIDDAGGLQVIVRELLDGGLLDGSALTCTGESLADQVRRLDPPPPNGLVIHPLRAPFKPNGGLRLLHGNLAPEGGAVVKVVGIERGIVDGVFVCHARVFDSERSLLDALQERPDSFDDKTMVVIRYEGPRGAPGMPELLEPTSRLTTLCRQRDITIGLMTDARFSGGSIGLVIGHVAPEALLGGPIALIEDGDEIVVDLNADRLDCRQLREPAVLARRTEAWKSAARANGGVHPSARPATSRMLARMRATAAPALLGGGMNLRQ